MLWAVESCVDRLSVGKPEVDGNPAVRDSYQAQGIPGLIPFCDGQEVRRPLVMKKRLPCPS